MFSNLLGGAAGGVLINGLSDLNRQFEEAGHGDKAQSWVGHGTNKPISPSELEEVQGPQRKLGSAKRQVCRGSSQLPD